MISFKIGDMAPKGVKTMEDWYKWTGVKPEDLTTFATAVARLQYRWESDVEDKHDAMLCVEDMCLNVWQDKPRVLVCTHCNNSNTYLFEYDDTNKAKNICLNCLLLIGSTDGERIEMDAVCFICNADLELAKVQTHMKTEHPDRYATMLEVHKEQGEDEKKAGGMMMSMAVAYKYRDMDKEEIMKKLSILDKELQDMDMDMG